MGTINFKMSSLLTYLSGYYSKHYFSIFSFFPYYAIVSMKKTQDYLSISFSAIIHTISLLSIDVC